MIINLKKYKSVICLDGDLPFEILNNIGKSKAFPILAADGAANKLFEYGIIPQAVIGDCDSVKPSIMNKVFYIKDENQDITDFEKVVNYATEKKLFPFIVTGISGGYLDRIFMNINVFSQTESVFLSDKLIGLALHDSYKLSLPINTKISLFGAPYCEITTKGLKWELKDSILSFGKFYSCSNRVISSDLSFYVKGCALIFVYLDNIIDAGYECKK